MSISQSYELGGGCMNIGLIMYIVIDRKMKNVCEIHNAECSESTTMLCLLLVKYGQDFDLHTQDNYYCLYHRAFNIK